MDALTSRRIVDCSLAGEALARDAVLAVGGDLLMHRLLADLARLRGRVGSEVFRDAVAARLRVLSAIRRGEIVTARMLGAASWSLRLSDADLRERYLRLLRRRLEVTA